MHSYFEASETREGPGQPDEAMKPPRPTESAQAMRRPANTELADGSGESGT